MIRLDIDFFKCMACSLPHSKSHRQRRWMSPQRGCRVTILKLRTVEAGRLASRMHFIVWKMSSVKVKKSREQNRRNIINAFLKGSQSAVLVTVCVCGRSHSLWRIWKLKDVNMLITIMAITFFKCFVHYTLLNSLLSKMSSCCYYFDF